MLQYFSTNERIFAFFKPFLQVISFPKVRCPDSSTQVPRPPSPSRQNRVWRLEQIPDPVLLGIGTLFLVRWKPSSLHEMMAEWTSNPVPLVVGIKPGLNRALALCSTSNDSSLQNLYQGNLYSMETNGLTLLISGDS